MDKFTYYDTIADLIPGIVSIWVISILGPIEGIDYSLLLTESQIIDAVLFISISFIIGHIIKFFSKFTIEPLLKKVFWRCKFFSEIYLIKTLDLCPEVELTHILSFVEKKLKFSKEDLSVLLDKNAFSDEIKRKKAIQLSQIIYRKLDAESKDISTATKAHTQNVFYGLFRNLSTLFLMLGILNFIVVCLKFVQPTISLKINTIISGFVALIFSSEQSRGVNHMLKGFSGAYQGRRNHFSKSK